MKSDCLFQSFSRPHHQRSADASGKSLYRTARTAEQKGIQVLHFRFIIFISNDLLVTFGNFPSHVVIAPSSVDKYSSDSFAGLLDLLKSVGNRTEDEESALWRQIKEHLAVLAYLIRGAAHSLRDNL